VIRFRTYDEDKLMVAVDGVDLGDVCLRAPVAFEERDSSYWLLPGRLTLRDCDNPPGPP
jgi:hypothetical protein